MSIDLKRRVSQSLLSRSNKLLINGFRAYTARAILCKSILPNLEITIDSYSIKDGLLVSPKLLVTQKELV